MACTPVDTVFQGVVTLGLGPTNVLFSLLVNSFGDVIFDVGSPPLNVPQPLTFPGGATGFFLTVISEVGSDITFIISKPGSACELNGSIISALVDTGDGTVSAITQTVLGVCCPTIKKKRRLSGFIPDTVCMNRFDTTNRERNCPDTINLGGAIYKKISQDNRNCCYQKI